MNAPAPHHIRIGRDETSGNGETGRIYLLPGSDFRARQIADHLEDVRVFTSPRQLNAYLGVYHHQGRAIDVGTLSTGMGCPSLDIVVTELIGVGARRLLRVGSAGSVQPRQVRAGSLVIATAAVRDEGTSEAYAPKEIPAVAHPDWISALSTAARDLGLDGHTYAGIVHTKDSLYGREFATGPLAARNHAYMEVLAACGVVATEMESAHLFILASVHTDSPKPISASSPGSGTVKAGSILAIIGDDRPFAPPEVAQTCEQQAVQVALASLAALLDLESPRL